MDKGPRKGSFVIIRIVKNIFYLVLGLIFIFGSFYLFLKQPSNVEKTLKIGDFSIVVEIASTPEERTQGLSNRDSLPTDSGLLFIFDESDFHGFWMRDMKFGIDIVWIDDGWTVIGVERNVLPETFPKVFYPPSKVRYVLELNAGLTSKHNIDRGLVINLE